MVQSTEERITDLYPLQLKGTVISRILPGSRVQSRAHIDSHTTTTSAQSIASTQCIARYTDYSIRVFRLEVSLSNDGNVDVIVGKFGSQLINGVRFD